MTDRQKRAHLREILADSKGAIAPGITDPIFARLAADCGYSTIHLSGNAIHKSFCLPDRNLLTVAEIAARTAQIADATNVPLIVDGGPAARQTDLIARAVRSLERAGADAVGVQLSDVEEFRHVAAGSQAPLVSLWPKARMTALEFLQLGFRIALMPSSVSLAALSAVKEMLLDLKDNGTERDYFNRRKDIQEVERWYRNLNMRGE